MIRMLVACSISVVLLPASSAADPILISASYSGLVTAQYAGSTTAQSSDNVNIVVNTAPTGTFPVSYAAAIAGPNYLGVAANAAIGSNSGDYAEANASSIDHLHVTGGPQQGILALGVSVIGFSYVQTTGSGHGFYQIDYTATAGLGAGCLFSGSNPGSCSNIIPGILLLKVPYSSDNSGIVLFEQELETYNVCDTDLQGTCSSASYYEDPVQIASITVEDVNGNPVPGASVTSLGGVNYNLPQTVVTPEPSSILLLGTGILSVLRLRSKRNCHQ